MKIVQVVPYFYPAWHYGGPGKLVFDTSKYFADNGHFVCVLTSNAFNRISTLRQEKKITATKHLQIFYYALISNKLAYKYKVFFTPVFFFNSLAKIIRSDIVHIHDFFTIQNFWAAFICYLFQTPYILSPHGTLQDKALSQRKNLKSLYMSTVGKQVLKRASKIIVSSKNEKDIIIKFGTEEKKITILGHAVNPKEFASKLVKKSAKKNFAIKSHKVVFTYLGRIHKLKGVKLLLEATEQACQFSSAFHLIIAGSDDGLLSEAKAFVKKRKLNKRISFLGTMYGKNKANLFKATDVFVYPSYSEGFSIGILEAASAGKALIITNNCNFPQVKNAKAGLVVNSRLKEIANAIGKILKNKKLIKTYGDNAKKLIENEYSSSFINQKILNIYTETTKEFEEKSLAKKIKYHLFWRINYFIISVLHFCLNLFRKTPTVFLGNKNAKWYIPKNAIKKGDLCYCFGAGEDISFDLALAKKYGAKVNCFDPTLRSIDYVKKIKNKPKNFNFYPLGIWKENKKMKFFEPSNCKHVSHSLVNLQKTENYFEANCKKLSTIMKSLANKKITLLKIDIEGAEHEVLSNIMSEKVQIEIICVEFDQPVSVSKIIRSFILLISNNYWPIKQDKFNFTFIKKFI